MPKNMQKNNLFKKKIGKTELIIVKKIKKSYYTNE